MVRVQSQEFKSQTAVPGGEKVNVGMDVGYSIGI